MKLNQLIKMSLIKIEEKKIRSAGGYSKVVTLPREYSRLLRAGDTALFAYADDGICVIAPKNLENKIARKLQELQELLKQEE